MKLLRDRKKLADKGKLQMCMAEYDGSWLPYEQPLADVTIEWLLEEITYDDCTRKEEIINYLKENYVISVNKSNFNIKSEILSHAQSVYKLLESDDMYYLKSRNVLNDFHEYLEDLSIKGIISNKQFDELYDKAFDIASIY